MKRYTLILASTYILWPVLAETKSVPDCAELLRNRCQTCHYLQRVCSQVGEKSKRRWKTTVKRMIQQHGAEINAEEQEYLVECLSPPSPDIKKECNQ